MDKRGNAVVDHLKKSLTKKLDTTMIGALSAIETFFGELWNQGSFERNEDEEDWFKKFQALRSKILDNGNNQKRKLEEEVDGYEISQRYYHVDMPVKPRTVREDD